VTLGLLLTTPVWALVLAAAGPVLAAGDPVNEISRELISGHAVYADYGLWLVAAGHELKGAITLTVCVVIATFLSGGILDRLARARPVGSASFFSACGGYAGRLLRLTLPFLLIEWWLLADVRAYLTGPIADVAFLLALCAIMAVFDFARVRLVVEDRRSAIGAIAASIRFIRGRFWRVSALYLINFLVLAGVFQMFSSAGPVAMRADWLMTLLALIGLLFRAWLYMSCAASEIAFFQDELAHAGYSARPLPMWPDSASAEGLRNLVQPRPLR
jgi:hypothetical protein